SSHARATSAKVTHGHQTDNTNTPGEAATSATVAAIPGPRSQALDAERERYLPRGVYTYHHIYPAAAAGARLTDVDGNAYLDFAGGIGTLNVGHSHPAVVAAIQEQAARYTHTCAHVLTPEPYVRLAQRLAELAPGPSAKKILLVNSGAEAVENAVK